ncbi:FkbM family methyltransferase, partial [Oxalobacteraceae bacterium OM1]
MTFISYAQNFEDVMLWRALKHVDNGFYIDVGANHPEIDSVTLAFYERGWRGINVEPMQDCYRELRVRRPADVNLDCAVGSRNGEIVFYEVPGTGLSTTDAAIAQQHREAGMPVIERAVPVRMLADICREHAKGPIHFLKIDVEGMESAVLSGMDFTAFRP